MNSTQAPVNSKILIVGCGDIGIPLAAQLVAKGASVYGLRRNASKLPAFIHPISADVTEPNSLACLQAYSFSSIIVTLTPGEFSDERYQRIYVEGLRNILASCHFDYCYFVSSTSVYHQKEAEWVNELSPTQPENFSGQRLLEAEALLDNLPATIIRFAGIYGPGRFRLIEQAIAGEGSPELYSNRIHQQDCIDFLMHLIEKRWQGETLERLYIGVDNEPVKLSEVKDWLAEQLGFEASHLSKKAATRRGSKRCSNEKLTASGYQLQYPSFREGYTELLEAYKNRQ